MEHVRDYVEHLRSKPEHIRRRIALGSSLAIVAVIAVGWMIALGSSGTLALSAPTADDEANAALAASAKESANQFTNLLGAASAYQSSTGPGQVVIVNGASSSTLEKPAEDTRTVIPF
jgi:hypothetical protein